MSKNEIQINLTDPAIESPKRTSILIHAAQTVNFPLSELPELVFDALEADPIESLFPIYTVAPDRDNADPRAFMIFMINTLSGSDDDHDYLRHDLDHALNLLDYCDDHPTVCATCCDADH
jgi:hypothetical protein